MTTIPTLQTPRLTLRAFREADWPLYAALFADLNFTRHLGNGQTRSPSETWAGMARAIGQWSLRGYGLFALEFEGKLAGHAGFLHPHPWSEPELAYAIAPDLQRQGLAKEACTAILAWAWHHRAIAQPVSFIRPANTPSIRLAQALGAVLEANTTLMDAPVLRFRHSGPVKAPPGQSAPTVIETPVFHTKRLRLRAFCAGDFAPLSAIHADAAVMRYLGGGIPRDPNLTWTNMTFWCGGWGLRGTSYLAVTELETGALIGRAGIIDAPDWPEPELGYTFAQSAWSRGYATEASKAVRDWAWSHLKPACLYSYIKRGNESSANVARKLGATLEGEFEFEGKATERWSFPKPTC